MKVVVMQDLDFVCLLIRENAMDQIEILNKHLLITSKPMIYLINLSEKDYIRKESKWLMKMEQWIDENDKGARAIPFSAAFELKMLEMETDEEREKYAKEVGATSVLDKIIVDIHKDFNLEYFYTDMEKGFIMAEVMKFDDFKEEGSEAAVKSAGKYRQQGRDYVVEDGDIIFFKFNAPTQDGENPKVANCSRVLASSDLNWARDPASAAPGSSSFDSLMVRGKNESL
ncbi:Obg-like ATPase [Branchiostoma belcheri]|nr:Obg-like ATPase [Branchiostoma belcheri]